MQGFHTKEGTEGDYCLKCQKTHTDKDKNVHRVYYSNNGDNHICKLETGSDIKFCRRYKTEGSVTTCVKCHTGFHPDWDGNTYGKVCVSDSHPGAVPGCKYYKKINKDATEYEKYEALRCRICEH